MQGKGDVWKPVRASMHPAANPINAGRKVQRKSSQQDAFAKTSVHPKTTEATNTKTSML